MMVNKILPLIIGIMLLFSLAFISATKIDPNDPMDRGGKFIDKKIIKFDGEYTNGVKQKDKSQSDVWIDKFEEKKEKINGKDFTNKIYHVDSKKVGLVNATLEFYYDFQPDYIQHIQHSGNLERVFFPNDWTWTPDGETGKGWVTLDVENIDEGVGSNTFPIGQTGPQWARDGYFAGKFDGVTSKVEIVNKQELSVTQTNTTSFALWFNPSEYQAYSYTHIFGKGGPGTYEYWGRYDTSSGLVFTLSNNSGTVVCSSGLKSIFLQNNSWQFFVVNINYSFNSQNISMFRNGVNVGNTTCSSTNIPLNSTSNLQIGTRYSNPFNGSIDNFEMFNRTLSDLEITQLYQNGRTSPVCNLITNGQVLCIDFDDFSVQDKSGNGNNGVPTNLTYVEIQANKRTLVEGVDYTLDKITGLLTLSPDYLYNLIASEWTYNQETGFHVSIIKLLAGLICIIVLVIVAIYVINQFNN